MQIVIEIPNFEWLENEEDFKEAVKEYSQGTKFDKEIRNALLNATPLPEWHGRKFEEIVVKYPPAELCTYPEYRGKPYFSIKYEENGKHIIGFGTYKPEVLSSYLREYFIAPTIIEADGE